MPFGEKYSFNIFCLSEVSLRGNIHVTLKHFLRRNRRMISLSEQVTEISGGKPELDNIKLATRCRFFSRGGWLNMRRNHGGCGGCGTFFRDLHISRSKWKILFRCEAYLSTSRDSHAFDTQISWEWETASTLQGSHTFTSGCVFRHFLL